MRLHRRGRGSFAGYCSGRSGPCLANGGFSRGGNRRAAQLRAFGVVERRIQQGGVFAHHAPLRPGQFEEKIKIGLTHGFAAGNANVIHTPSIDDNFELEFQQYGGACHTGALKLRGIRQLHVEGFKIGGGSTENFDFSRKRLVEGG